MAPGLMWLMRVFGGCPSGKEEPPSLHSECFEGKQFFRDATSAQIPPPTAWKRGSRRRMKPSFSAGRLVEEQPAEYQVMISS
jgi:hypothetical protein